MRCQTCAFSYPSCSKSYTSWQFIPFYVEPFYAIHESVVLIMLCTVFCYAFQLQLFLTLWMLFLLQNYQDTVTWPQHSGSCQWYMNVRQKEYWKNAETNNSPLVFVVWNACSPSTGSKKMKFIFKGWRLTRGWPQVLNAQIDLYYVHKSPAEGNVYDESERAHKPADAENYTLHMSYVDKGDSTDTGYSLTQRTKWANYFFIS